MRREDCDEALLIMKHGNQTELSEFMEGIKAHAEQRRMKRFSEYHQAIVQKLVVALEEQRKSFNK